MIPEETQEKIKQLIEKTCFSVDEISFTYDEQDGSFWCRITTQESKRMIGKNGEILRALNHLVRKMIHQASAEQDGNSINILVDINNYQQERVDNLRTLAHMLAERARFFKSKVEADPMSAFERRIIHEHLAEALDVKTESIGHGKDRRVTITYINPNI